MKRKLNNTGASLVEYALLASLITLIAMVSVRYFGQKTRDQFYHSTCALSGQIYAFGDCRSP